MGTDRERAFVLTGKYNRAQQSKGKRDRWSVYYRTVTHSDWAPANTGIVGPPMRGGIED